MIEPMTQEEYANLNQVRCPHCRSDIVEHVGSCFVCLRDWMCLNCGAKWHLLYVDPVVTGYMMVKDPAND